jgi:tetratricopeptide (TPR) repeat protein
MVHPVDVEILRALGWLNAEVGYHDQALSTAEEAVERAERRNNRFQIFNARWSLNVALYLGHDYQRLRAESQRLYAIASDEGFHSRLAIGDLYSGIALGGLGQITEAIERLRRAQAEFERLGNPLLLYWVGISRLAIYLAKTGRFQEAIDFATEAVSTSEHTLFKTLTLIHLGEVLRLASAGGFSDSLGSAESRLQEAINCAREHGTKTWELEAATRLSELWRDQGKCQQAHSLLAPLYDWFIEGHDAPIIREAKTLLDELA